MNTNPEHEDVIYTEWGLNALDLEVVPPDCPYPLFPVKALALHTYMQIGKGFSTWMRDRIGKFQFVENVDFVEIEGLSSPNLGSSKARAQKTKDYWLTSTTARMMAADVNSERGVQVIKMLVARHERLTDLEEAGRPTFNLPTTFAEALRLLADTSEVNEQLKLENTQLGTDLTAKEEQVEFLEKTVEAVKTSEERTVDMLMARMEVSDKAIPPTKFFKQTASILGYSSVEGFAYLIAAGIFSKPVKNEWGTNQYEPMAPHDKCGYFQPAYQTNHRSIYDEQGYKTYIVRDERLVTYHLITALSRGRRDDCSVTCLVSLKSGRASWDRPLNPVVEDNLGKPTPQSGLPLLLAQQPYGRSSHRVTGRSLRSTARFARPRFQGAAGGECPTALCDAAFRWRALRTPPAVPSC